MLTFFSPPPAALELPEVLPGEGLAPTRGLLLRWLFLPALCLLESLRAPRDDWLLDLLGRRKGVAAARAESGCSFSVLWVALEEGLPVPIWSLLFFQLSSRIGFFSTMKRCNH